MDPLVRAALALQQLLARGLPTAHAALLGAYLALWAARRTPPEGDVAAAVLLLAGLTATAARRLRRIDPLSTTRLDLELGVHATVAMYLGVLSAPGGLEGPAYPLIDAMMMLVAGFSRAGAAVGTVAFAIGLEAVLLRVVGVAPAGLLFPHAALAVAFAALNLGLFRAEIARVRRLSRARIEGEIEKMREAARSYRLLGAPTVMVDGEAPASRAVARSDEERLLRSSVEQIQESLQLALDLLRQALGARTTAIFWLSDSGSKLRLREVSTEANQLECGPLRATEGILAAAIQRGGLVSATGAKAAELVPYDPAPGNVGAVAALPLIEHGQTRGVLVSDRVEATPLTANDEKLLHDFVRYALRAIESERVFVQLERAKSEQGKLYRAVELLARAATEAEVIDAGVASAREFTSFDFAVVTLSHRETGEHEICAVSGEGAEGLVGRTFRHNSGLVSMVVANRHPLPYRGDYDQSRQVVFSKRLPVPAMPSLLVLPLVVHDAVLGTLVLGSQRKGAFGEVVRPTLEVLARHVAVSLANARMIKRLEDLATTDGLTGLFNKRALIDVAMQKLRSAERFRRPLSVLVCDLDHFKKVNDGHGHDVGDLVLRAFADVLRRTKRDTDVVGRFGGEEFILVCEETDSEGARLLAERIRAELSTTKVHAERGTLQVTCSIGVATAPAAGRQWETLFKSADESVYASKRAGRNRVTVWSPGVRGAAA